RAQIEACFADFDIGAVKLGMLAASDVIQTVADALDERRPRFVVLDPVMVATSGARLLQDSALHALRARLLPLADVVTPNLPEAELLLGHSIASVAAMRDAARELLQLGARNVLLKGGHLRDTRAMIDVFADAAGVHDIVHPRIDFGEAHGTGCTLASAIAARLCRGSHLHEACTAAADYVHRALRLGYRAAHGDMLLLDHFGAAPASLRPAPHDSTQ
ncbi:MAG: PfkB family carbohydrate kinase, partial [Pantoea sp.]|uniref:bifunctional hydroxymethylpyrimidine kinase/phosphomethylpyrimidine kinase n=1 Tax=Pantoea sp. TaxID=69393 RepID=UPI0039E4771B